ncbi:MAG: response regulator [Rhodoferax sp.]|nr:response regulator [Rhodoferax sp.]
MGTPISVLIVDDSMVSRMMVRGFIKQYCPDWTITEAKNGDDALTKIAEIAPNLVILDVNMPGMDGFETAEKISAIAPQTKIAFLTGNIQDSSKSKAGIMGHGFVEKPVTPESFAKLKAFMDQ